MVKKILFSLVVIVTMMMVSVGVASAEDNQRWKGEYFSDKKLEDREFVEYHRYIDFNWGTGSPDSSELGRDDWSARWTQTLNLPKGTYEFTMTVDDGGRLYINNKRVIDKWQDQYATYTYKYEHPGGNVDVKMEYYDNNGNAIAKLDWKRTDQPSNNSGWKGEYYDGKSLSEYEFTEYADNINFDWGTGSPSKSKLGNDDWSVRWTRSLDLPAGTYEFKMTVDDGGRLYINGNRVIDKWGDQYATYTYRYQHGGGKVDVKMEYFEHNGNAIAKLKWDLVQNTPTPPTQTPAPGGGIDSSAIIIDNTDVRFSSGGYPGGWKTANAGYGGQMLYSENSLNNQEQYEWARWYFRNMTAGRYEVYVYIPDSANVTTTKAPYWVRHDGGYKQTIVNQSGNRGKWVSLGTYSFGQIATEFVSLSDVSGETRGTTLVGFDAVAYVPR